MNRCTRLPLAAAALIFMIGCRGDTVSPPVGGPMFAVSDGAHDGNPDFFFLPPLFKSPNSDPDFQPAAFNGALKPAVEICELDAPAADGSRECIAGGPLKRFGPSAVSVSLTDQLYQVNWNTGESNLSVSKFYRIRVLVGARLLGFADVDPVSNGSQLKNVQTGEYIGLVDGRTLPIKFRIEQGALCAGGSCSAGTINLSQGGGVELVTPDEDFHFDIPAGTTATFGGVPVTDVTFNLEECSGIDVDLPIFGDCLRVTTYFDVGAGATTHELQLSKPALVSMCVLEPGLPQAQEDFITLHQQDGALIRALPHAPPNCNVISGRAPASGWAWIRDLAARLLSPKPAYASSRTALFNLGGGGNTGLLGAECTSSPTARGMGMALVECGSAVAPQMSAAALIAPPRTISDFQFALPAKIDYFNPDDARRSAGVGDVLTTKVKVTDWNNAPVEGALVTFTIQPLEGPGTILGTAISGEGGIAEIDWPIAAGENTLVAGGRGIAKGKPYMPDISLPTADQPEVMLKQAGLIFTAFGGGADLVITSLTHTPAEPTDGELIEYTAVVKNVGSAPVTRPTVRIDVRQEEGTAPWPGETTTLTAGGILNPGESVELTRNRSLQLPAGIYAATAQVDPNNVVAESNEENNGGTDHFFVTEGAPTINGVLGFAEWDGAQVYGPFTVNLPGGEQTTATFYLRNAPSACCNDMFLGVRFGRDLSIYEDVIVAIRADENQSGDWDSAEDGFVVQQRIGGARKDAFFDEFFDVTQNQGQPDVATGGTNDGITASTDGLAPTVIEAQHETNNEDERDAYLTTDQQLPFLLIINIGPPGAQVSTIIPLEGPWPIFFVR